MALDTAKAFHAERLLSNGLLTPMTGFWKLFYVAIATKAFVFFPNVWLSNVRLGGCSGVVDQVKTMKGCLVPLRSLSIWL